MVITESCANEKKSQPHQEPTIWKTSKYANLKKRASIINDCSFKGYDICNLKRCKSCFSMLSVEATSQ